MQYCDAALLVFPAYRFLVSAFDLLAHDLSVWLRYSVHLCILWNPQRYLLAVLVVSTRV